jgi:hypothetical protein
MTNRKFQFVAGIILLASFICAAGLSFYFGTFPHAPEPSKDLVVSFNIHGVDHYISPTFMMLFGIAASICVSALFALAIAKGLERRKAP